MCHRPRICVTLSALDAISHLTNIFRNIPHFAHRDRAIGIWSRAFIKLSASIAFSSPSTFVQSFPIGAAKICSQSEMFGGVYFLDQWFRKLIRRPDLIDANAFHVSPPRSPVTSALHFFWCGCLNTFLVPFIKPSVRFMGVSEQPPPIGKRAQPSGHFHVLHVSLVLFLLVHLLVAEFKLCTGK